MSGPIRPALQSEEWQQRRSGPVSIDTLGDETHLVLRDPDGDVVSVSGADAIFAVMALANATLPNEDPRKLTITDIAVLRILMERISKNEPNGRRMIALAIALRDKLNALLPPSQSKKGLRTGSLIRVTSEGLWTIRIPRTNTMPV